MFDESAQTTRNGFVLKRSGKRVPEHDKVLAKWEYSADGFRRAADAGCPKCVGPRASEVCFHELASALRSVESSGSRGTTAHVQLSRVRAGLANSADPAADAEALLGVDGALDFLLSLVGESDFQRDKMSTGTFQESRACCEALLLLADLSQHVAERSTDGEPAGGGGGGGGSNFALRLLADHPFFAFDVAIAAGRLGGCPQGRIAESGAAFEACVAILRRLGGTGQSRESVRRGLCWAVRAHHFEYRDGPRGPAECDALAELRAQLDVSESPAMDQVWAGSGCYGSDLDEGAGSNGGDLALARFVAETRRLTRSAMCAWLCSASEAWPPASELSVYSKKERERRYRRCAELNARAKTCSKQAAKPINQQLTALVLNVDETFIGKMIDGKVFEQSRRYGDDARAYDPALSEMEEFQAGRNAFTIFGLQLCLLQCPVECHAAALAYSLLYPYTDNLLDSAAVDRAAKLEFQHTFRKWLKGEAARAPRDTLETKIHDQVRAIEGKWPRAQHPNVYYSLVAIHDGQSRSLTQHCPFDDPKLTYNYLADCSVDKGSTSVLADLYVAHGGTPARWHAAYSMNLGAALQFVDDIQDIEEDIDELNATLFSVPSAAGFPADRSARRMANFLCEILRPNSYGFDSEALTEEDRVTVGELLDGKMRMCLSIAFKAIARTAHSFTPQFVQEAECRMPLPLRGMQRLAGMRSLLTVVKKDRI